MAKQGWFESDEDFRKRAAKEDLQERGYRQGFFESDEDFVKRATREDLRDSTGLRQGFFESDEDYVRRAGIEDLRQRSGERQGFFESDERYIDRASTEAARRESGLRQGFFESNEDFRFRALKSGARPERKMSQKPQTESPASGGYDYGEYSAGSASAQPVPRSRGGQIAGLVGLYALAAALLLLQRKTNILQFSEEDLFAPWGLRLGGVLALVMAACDKTRLPWPQRLRSLLAPCEGLVVAGLVLGTIADGIRLGEGFFPFVGRLLGGTLFAFPIGWPLACGAAALGVLLSGLFRGKEPPKTAAQTKRAKTTVKGSRKK